MLHFRILACFFSLTIISAGSTLLAQSGTGHNPVSRFGYGLPWDFGISRNEAMGGCGQVVPDQDHPNFLNPALIHFNRKVNLNSDLRYQYRQLSQLGRPGLNQGTAGPALISILVPLGEEISAGAGIRPFSSREFTYQKLQRGAGSDSIGLRIRGSGGLSQAFMSVGFRLHKMVSLGLEGSYVFGTLEDSVTFGVLPSSLNYTFSNIVKRKVSQFMLRPGIHLMSVLSRKKSVFIAGGFSTEIGQRISASRFNQFSIPGTGIKDTLENQVASEIVKPQSMKFGIGLFSPLRWSLSLEGEYIRAATLPAENGILYTDAMSWRAGGEYCPGIKKSTSYFNLITYRAGVQYRQLPYSYEGKNIHDLRLSAGASFPVVRKDAKFSRPLINLSLAAGKRGIPSSNLGSENYFQVSLGLTLNDFLWFNRYKID